MSFTTHETAFGIAVLADCMDYMATMQDKSVDLCLTSPPYDGLREYGDGKGFNFNKDLFEPVAKSLQPKIVQGGVCVWVVGDQVINGSESLTSFKQAIYFVESCGMNLHDTMIYAKDSSPFPDKTRYKQAFEYMFIFSNGKPKTFNPLLDKVVYKKRGITTMRQKDGTTKAREIDNTNEYCTRKNVWTYGIGYMKSSKYKDAFSHPAIFPEQLAHDHIVSWSNAGDTVLDPFAGSFTTAIACIRTGRRYICVEKEPKYFEIGVKRIEAELAQADFLRDGDLCE